MSKKIYKFVKKLGNGIAILMMFSPIVIVSQFSKISEPFFWLVCSILYDIYMYSIIIKENLVEDAKKRYHKYIKNIDETLPSLKLSDEEKLNNIEEFIDDFFKGLEK